MDVKAKFRCTSVVTEQYDGGHSRRVVKFSAVYGTSGENADYAKATPWGELSMQIDQTTPAYDHFKPGTEYGLLFQEIPAAEAASL